MQREIKFRGKSKNNNEWCCGTYIFTDDNKNNPFGGRPFKESHKIVFWCSGDWNMGGWDYEEVIPETIGQYIGLKDKNGKEIYEGDIILNQQIGWWDSKYIGIVKYCEKNCRYEIDISANHIHPDRILFDKICTINDGYTTEAYINEFEVIGNIHDNPELIFKRRNKNE